jgi:site-specific recombinase XerD
MYGLMYSLEMRTRTLGLTPYRRHNASCGITTETYYPSTPAQKKADICECPIVAKGWLKHEPKPIRNLGLDTTEWTAAFERTKHLETLGRIPQPTTATAAKLPGEMSVADAAKRWLATKDTRRWGTHHNCEVFVNQRLLPWCESEGITSVRAFDDQDTSERFIKSWRNMRTRKVLEVSSWDAVRTHMSMLIGFCVTKKFCTENHFQKYDAFTKQERNRAESESGKHGLELDEVDRLFTYMAALPASTVTPYQIIDNRRLEAMMLLMFWTGMRISDAVNFCDQEFERNLEGNGWQVNFIALKNGRRCIVPVGDDLVEKIRSLKPWLDSTTNKKYYFRGTPITDERSEKRYAEKQGVNVKLAMRRCQKEMGAFLHPTTAHSFRHGFAIHRLNRGVDPQMVADWMGDDLKTVLDNYKNEIRSGVIIRDSEGRKFNASLLRGSKAGSGKARADHT